MPEDPSSPANPLGEAQTAGAAASDVITLPREGLYQHLQKLIETDPDVRQNFDTLVGRRAAEKYNPELGRRDREIEHLRKLTRQREIQTMKPEDVEKKFLEDPKFASEYAELVHYKEPDGTQEREQEIILTAVNEVFSWAEKKGLSSAETEKFKIKAAEGAYGDETVHWSVSLQRLQADLTDAIISKTGTPPPAQVNTNLVKPGPDTQRGSRPATDGFPDTIAAFKKLPAEQRQAIANTPEGVEHLSKLAKQGR